MAAAGNGNVLGSGINIDQQPFYPASYDLDNILTVAASDPEDQLARFSNFGSETVDLAAPGVGILSTLPGGRYGTGNGTSMAVPHVTGTAALIAARLGTVTVSEAQDAILFSINQLSDSSRRLATGGRVNAAAALQANVFAPRAKLLQADTVTASGAFHEITIRYTDLRGLDPLPTGRDHIRVYRSSNGQSLADSDGE